MTQVKQENVIIYSKTHCPSCLKAKATFDKLNVPYTVKTLGVDMQPSELMKIFEEKKLPQPRTAPQIFIGDTYIGGYEALEAYIENTGFNGSGHSVG